MRENRTHGSEGGEGESLSLPLSQFCANGLSGLNAGLQENEVSSTFYPTHEPQSDCGFGGASIILGCTS